MDASLREALLAVEPQEVEAGAETDAMIRRVVGVGIFPNPTRDWSAAMEALMSYVSQWSLTASGPVVYVSFQRGNGWYEGEVFHEESGPLAICRAILAAAKAEAEQQGVPDQAGRVC